LTTHSERDTLIENGEEPRNTGDLMDILSTPKGTMFRLYGDLRITTSKPFYCHIHHITKVKTHNITTGETTLIGRVAMLDATPNTQETT